MDMQPDDAYAQHQMLEWKKRYHPLIGHPVQMRLELEQTRFKVVPAGRRSGKTERAKRRVIKEALKLPNGRFFCAAPTRDQAKRIYWSDIKMLIPPIMRGEPSESELCARLKNGAEIYIIGMDKPQRFEGQPWDGGVVDEFADMKESAWQENIRPALDTMGREAWCWLIGVPDGLNHYYEIAEYAMTSNDPEWGYYTWKSAEILPAKTIMAAKRELSPRAYRQEYEAAFENATGRVYEDYGRHNHTDKVCDPKMPIHWTHDFNFLPMSSVIVQLDPLTSTHAYCVDEIILNSADAKIAATEFAERYKHHQAKKLYLYGDASGRAGEKHNIASDYIEMETILRKEGWSVERRVPLGNPAIKNGQNSLRSRIMNAAGDIRFFVNPAKCKVTSKGLNIVSLKVGSAFQEEEIYEQHVTTALRYFTHMLWPIQGEASRIISVPHMGR
jgi:Terminase large subunit, T4likevirus-type, N-terminal